MESEVRFAQSPNGQDKAIKERGGFYDIIDSYIDAPSSSLSKEREE